jgi:polyisoprenoid-binding protein YceI
MRRLSALAALLIVAMPAVTQAPMKLPSTPPGRSDPTAVIAGNYAMEPAHTEILFALDHLGFSIFRGFLSNVSGTLKLDPRNLMAARLDVTVPIDSIYTPSRELNEELIGPKFFDVQHWPNATFTSTSIVPGPDGKALVNGNLTLHGQTHAAQMTVKLHGAGKSMMGRGQAIGFDGRMMINRSEYGIAGGIPLVSDQVQITISAAFEQQ